jgi:hypothetical protein
MEDNATPRINGGMLPDFIGKDVRIVGKVEGVLEDGSLNVLTVCILFIFNFFIVRWKKSYCYER